MRIVYTGTTTKLASAVEAANAVLASESFWESIIGKPNFDYTDLTSIEIAQRIRNSSSVATVHLWKPALAQYLLQYRDTIAMVDPTKPGKVFYHQRKLGRSVGQIFNTLVHEYVHIVDNFGDGSPDREISHGDNSPEGKQDSAPYWIGDLAQRLYTGGSEKGATAAEMHSGSGTVNLADIVD